MKLDRNANPDGRGKYALVNMRKLAALTKSSRSGLAEAMVDTLQIAGVVEYGNEAPEKQFFVMRFSDQFTVAGLKGYLAAVKEHIEHLRWSAGKARRDGCIDASMKQLEFNQSANELEVYARDLEAQIRDAEKITTKTPD